MSLLEVRDLTKYFGGFCAVDRFEFSMSEGEIVGLIGPNGAGKSTFFNLVTGFLTPSKGTVSFLSQAVRGWAPHKVTRLGMVRTFQMVRPFGDLTVLENVTAAALNQVRSRSRAEEKAKEVLAFFHMTEIAKTIAKNLPIGYRKRLELARALATKPKLLLLDEVMAGLNPTETEEMIGMLKRIHQSGVTLLIIEHIMAIIMSLSERIVVMHHGQKIAEGKPQQVAKDPRVLDAYLGEEYVFA